MLQWDFLNFLVELGSQYPTFQIRMNAEVTDLIEDGGSVVGLCAKTPNGPLDVRTALVVGAGGTIPFSPPNPRPADRPCSPARACADANQHPGTPSPKTPKRRVCSLIGR